MKKRFTTRTLDNVRVNFLALPNSNYFRIEIVNHYGANIERLYEKTTGKNVYGISHLVEHLAFKSSKDFSTQELMDIAKNDGFHNAGTTYDFIDYFFATTAQKMDLAIKYCFNVAYNDLTKISEKEFATEKNVVLNEIRRYADDDQTVFYYNTSKIAANLHAEDNIIGSAETIAAFTLADAIAVKKLLLTCPNITYNISYDPAKTTENEIFHKLLEQRQRFETVSNESISSHEMYTSLLKDPKNGSFTLACNAEQAMNMFIIPLECDVLTGSLVMRYIESLAQQSSLNEIIREKHGLTYGIDAYIETFGHKCFIQIACDVDKSTQQQFLSLFKESINLSADNFNEESHEALMKIVNLRDVVARLDLKMYETLFYFDKLDRSALEPYLDVLQYDIDAGYEAIYEASNFEVMKKNLDEIKRKINTDAYSRISSV